MKIYDKLVRVLGTESANAICRAHGGLMVYIPQKGTGKLDDCLSAEQMDRLREALGCGLRITFPLGPYRRYRRSKRRRQRGYELLDSGHSVRSVAKALGVCSSTVSYWKRLRRTQCGGPDQSNLVPSLDRQAPRQKITRR